MLMGKPKTLRAGIGYEYIRTSSVLPMAAPVPRPPPRCSRSSGTSDGPRRPAAVTAAPAAVCLQMLQICRLIDPLVNTLRQMNHSNEYIPAPTSVRRPRIWRMIMAGRSIGWRGFGLLALVLLAANGGYIWWQGREPARASGFAGGNGRPRQPRSMLPPRSPVGLPELLPREGRRSSVASGSRASTWRTSRPAAAGPAGGAGETGDRRSRGRRSGGTQQPNAGAITYKRSYELVEAKFPQRPATRIPIAPTCVRPKRRWLRRTPWWGRRAPPRPLA